MTTTRPGMPRTPEHSRATAPQGTANDDSETESDSGAVRGYLDDGATDLIVADAPPLTGAAARLAINPAQEVR
ncbi:hypothetical protein ACWEO2_18540 [Nocardia sp. NPDC004278]